MLVHLKYNQHRIKQSCYRSFGNCLNSLNYKFKLLDLFLFCVFYSKCHFFLFCSVFVQVSQRCCRSSAVADLLSSRHFFNVHTYFYWCSCVPGQLCTSREFYKKASIEKVFQYHVLLSVVTKSAAESCCVSLLIMFVCVTVMTEMKL